MSTYKEELRLLINLCLGLNELTSPRFDSLLSIEKEIELRNAYFELHQRANNKKEKNNQSIFFYILNHALSVYISNDIEKQRKTLHICTVLLGMAIYLLATIKKEEQIDWENPDISDEEKISEVLEEALTVGDIKKLHESIRFWSNIPVDKLPFFNKNPNIFEFHNQYSPLRNKEIIENENKIAKRLIQETETLKSSINDQYDSSNPLEQIRDCDEILKEKLQELYSEFKRNQSVFDDDTDDDFIEDHLDDIDDEVRIQNHYRYIKKDQVDNYSNNSFTSFKDDHEVQNDGETSIWGEVSKVIKVGMSIHGYISDGIELASDDFSGESIVNYFAKFALNKVLDVPTGGLWSIGCTMFSIAKTLFFQPVGSFDE